MDKETKIACKIFYDAGKEFWDDEEWDILDSDINTHQVALYAIKKLLKDKQSIEDYIKDLKTTWEPKTKTQTGYGYHGSSKGDKKEYILYFDEYRSEWTTKDIAFQGYVFKHIDIFIKNIAVD